MHFTVIIPSRFGSTRLPAKALADIADRPLIAHVVNQATLSSANRVIVATDDGRILTALNDSPCEVVMTSSDHQSGSDRLAEVVNKLGFDDEDIVVNVQGDEPMIPPKLIDEVAQSLIDNPAAQMSTAAQLVKHVDDFHNPNMVKVVTNRNAEALYFSRAAVPHNRSSDSGYPEGALHHIGIYAYRVGFLKQFSAMPPTALETTESLEQLRALENGATIAVHTINYEAGIGVDTQADLDKVRALIAEQE